MTERSETSPGAGQAPPARESATARPPAAAAEIRPQPARAAEPSAGPLLRDFLSGPDTRLRDLLAFGMAADAGRPLSPDGVEALRRKADAELHAHAFRVLHNHVETIRREAVEEQISRFPRPLSFTRVVAANLLTVALIAVAALLAQAAAPEGLARLYDQSAQFVARILAGS